MYFIVIRSEMNAILCDRLIYSVANCRDVFDVCDVMKQHNDGGSIFVNFMDAADLETIIEEGYTSEEEAAGAVDSVLEAVDNLNGPFFDGEYSFVDADGLRELYSTLKQQFGK